MKSREIIPIVLLVVAFAWSAAGAVRTNSLVLDEPAHIAAGVSYWDLGRFGLYRQNPPLVQAICGLPAWVLGCRMDYSSLGEVRGEVKVGHKFAQDNAARLPRIVSWSRYMVMVMGLACALILFLWASQIAGPAVGTVVAALWLLDPNVGAFSSIVTTDMGATAFGGLAGYAYWNSLRRPSPKATLAAGIALGLAVASKFSLVALYPAWIVLALLARIRKWPDLTPADRGGAGIRLLAILVTSLVVINATYLFDGSLRPLGGFKFRSRLLSGKSTIRVYEPPAENRFRSSLMGDFPVPLPRDFVLGFDLQRWDSEIGLTDVRDGRAIRGGLWYSPFRTLIRKSPPGTLILTCILAPAALVMIGRGPFASAFPLVPFIFLSGLLALHVGLNWPVRYMLPAVFYLLILLAKPMASLLSSKSGKAFVLACLAWNVVEMARTGPHVLSYVNPLVGGLDAGQRNLGGSNFDWGQDLGRLRAWRDLQASTLPLVVSYHGPTSPELLGVSEGELPRRLLLADPGPIVRDPIAGGEDFLWAVSSNLLNGMTGDYVFDDGTRRAARLTPGRLDAKEAFARIGSTLFVFRVVRDSEGRFVTRGRGLEGCLTTEHDEAFGIDAAP